MNLLFCAKLRNYKLPTINLSLLYFFGTNGCFLSAIAIPVFATIFLKLLKRNFKKDFRCNQG